MIALGEEGLKQHIKTIGLFNAKAKNVIALSEMLVAEHGGEVPADRDALVTLPGVGRKTANVVMNCAFGAETFAVDTHMFRVGNRTGLARGKTPRAVEASSRSACPQPFRRHAHHWLILHGRYTCKARLPECWRCPVVDLCAYKAKVLEPPAGASGRDRAPCVRDPAYALGAWTGSASSGSWLIQHAFPLGDHRVATTLPTTLIAVRPMSRNRSTPRISPMPSAGTPN